MEVACFHNRTLNRRNSHSTEKTKKLGEVLFYGKLVLISALLDNMQSAFASRVNSYVLVGYQAFTVGRTHATDN